MGRKKKKEPDRLSIESAMATAAGMTYGKWKALQTPQKITRKIPDGWRLCEFCGKPFKKNGAQRFCEIGCRNLAYKEKEKQIKAEYMRGYRLRKASEATA